MTANETPDAAVHDADLVRYLDGELNATDRKRVDDALAADPALSRRMDQLRARGSRLTALLESSDPDSAVSPDPGAVPLSTAKVLELNAAWAAQQGVEPHVVPPHRPMPGYLRAAAVIAALLAGSLLVPPVRAWIVDALRSIASGSAESPAVVQPVPTMPVDTFGIGFATTATTFTIEFAAAPAAGMLVIESTARDSISAEVFREPGGTEELQRMRDDLLRVANPAVSTADYRVTVPARVAAVTVRVPGREDVVLLFAGDGPERRSIELGPRS